MDPAIGSPRAVPFSKKTGALFTNVIRNRCMKTLLRLSRAKLPSLKVARNTPFRSLSERLMSSGAKESADKLLSRMISIARKEGYPVKDGVKCQTLLLAFMISSHKSFSFAVEVERGLEQAVSDASVALVEWMEESAAGFCDCTILPKLLSTYLDAVDPWIAETGRVVSDMKGQMITKLDRVLSSPVKASTRHVMQRHRAGIVSSLPVDASAGDPLLFFISSGMREQIGHEVLLGNDIKHSHVGNIFDANFWALLHADLTKNPVIVTRVNLVAADIQKKLVNLSIALDTAVPDVAGILSHDFSGQRRIFDNVFALLREIHGTASADVFDTIDHDALASLGYWSSGILGLALNIMWSRADYMHRFEQKARHKTLRSMLQCSGVEWESSKFTKLLNRGLISLDSTREWLSRTEGNSWEEIVCKSWVGLIASDDVPLDQLPEVCRLDWRRITDLRKAFSSDSLAKVVVDAVRFVRIPPLAAPFSLLGVGTP